MYIDYWVIIVQVVLAIGAMSRGWGANPIWVFLGVVLLGIIGVFVAPSLLFLFGFSVPDLIFIGVMAYMIFNPRN
jgi:hypothetical protein